MPQLQFQGWRAGLDKVALTRLFRNHADMSLAAAKHSVDQILNAQSVIVTVDSVEVAQALAEEASALGAHCEVIASPAPASAERQ
jgi:hypothetical protein